MSDRTGPTQTADPTSSPGDATHSAHLLPSLRLLYYPGISYQEVGLVHLLVTEQGELCEPQRLHRGARWFGRDLDHKEISHKRKYRTAHCSLSGFGPFPDSAPPGQAFLLKDHGSTNGTTILGRLDVPGRCRARIPLQNSRCFLRQGDLICVGRLLMLFQSVAPGPIEEVHHEVYTRGSSQDLLTFSDSLKANWKDLEDLARHEPRCVSMEGERGTGKETFAKAFHMLGCKPGAFATLTFDEHTDPDSFARELFGVAGGEVGLLRVTDQGTLYLAGLDRAPPWIQERLASAISSRSYKPVNASTLATTQTSIVLGFDHSTHGHAGEGLAGRLDDLIQRGPRVVIQALRDRPLDTVALLLKRIHEHLQAEMIPLAQRHELHPQLLLRLLESDLPDNANSVIRFARETAAAFCRHDNQELKLPTGWEELLELNLSETLETGDERSSRRCRKSRRRPPSSVAEVQQAQAVLKDNVALTADYFGVERSTIYRVLDAGASG